jgi:cholesterol oxidase
MNERRAFGRKLLQSAAALGLQSVGGAGLMGLATGSSWASSGIAVTPVQNLIIGTGYGGAVTALRLAQRGLPVTMLEMGQLWNTPGLDGKVFTNVILPDKRAFWLRTSTKAVVSSFLGLPISFPTQRYAGILDAISYPGIDVYVGRGVGGGSLVNQAMAITPLQEVLQDVMPAGVDLAALYATYYPRAKAMLGVNELRPAYFERSPYYQYARVARKYAAKAGYTMKLLPSAYSYSYMEREEAGLVPKSGLNYEAAHGNNYGKGSLDKNYLAEAVATGRVTIHALHIVRNVTTSPGGRYIVQVDQIDTAGNLVAQKVYDAENLFLAAGSIGTSELLVKARDTQALPRLNEFVGTGWTSNGDIFSARANRIEDPVGTNYSLITSAGFFARDQNGKPVFSMQLPLPIPLLETWVNMSITMTSSSSSARFVYDAASGKAVLDWNAQNAAPAVASTKFIYDRINQANGTNYRTDLFGGKTIADTSTYHPIGGCPLGKATDLFGRVKGYRGLYITDGSLLPGNLVANPLLTVTAMAERNIERVLAEDFA